MIAFVKRMYLSVINPLVKWSDFHC